MIMKKILLLLPLLFLSTSFKTEEEPIWIGTIEVFFDPETNEFILSYNGNYHRCFTKYIIDHVYNDCDSTINKEALDQRFQWKNEPIDSSGLLKKDSTQIKPKKTYQL